MEKRLIYINTGGLTMKILKDFTLIVVNKVNMTKQMTRKDIAKNKDVAMIRIFEISAIIQSLIFVSFEKSHTTKTQIMTAAIINFSRNFVRIY